MPKGLPKSIGKDSGGVIPRLKSYTVAAAPSAAKYPAGSLIYVTNGAAGSPIVAFSDGTDWKRSDTGATIAAS